MAELKKPVPKDVSLLEQRQKDYLATKLKILPSI